MSEALDVENEGRVSEALNINLDMEHEGWVKH